MRITIDQDSLLIQKLMQEFLPELLGAGEDTLAAYEQGRTSDGDQNFSNYMVGCAFWDNSFNRISKLCRSGKSFFSCTIHSNVLEIFANIEGKTINFFIARVHPDSRTPRSAKGIKKLLQSQIVEQQCFLSSELQAIAHSKGVYTIGVDLDATNGIGKITFDLLVPTSNKTCQALTYATLYDSEAQNISAPVPESLHKGTVRRVPSPVSPAPVLAKSEPRGKAAPVQVTKKPLKKKAPEESAEKKLQK